MKESTDRTVMKVDGNRDQRMIKGVEIRKWLGGFEGPAFQGENSDD
jgi:hypothetical protein